jgi:hypothetical protein
VAGPAPTVPSKTAMPANLKKLAQAPFFPRKQLRKNASIQDIYLYKSMLYLIFSAWHKQC